MIVESENNITYEGPIDNSLNLGSHHIRKHYTIKLLDLRGVTYGGLHEDVQAAILQQVKLVVAVIEDSPGVPQSHHNTIIYLDDGKAYTPWGCSDIVPLNHSRNDGFHKSSQREEPLKEIVRMRLIG